LIEICESLEECAELVHIDLSYCVKLEKLPTTIHKLKKVETLLLEGCNISSFVVEIPSDLNLFVISLRNSLVRLSLANCNLFNESFPMDMSGLSRLKYLCLDWNPIVSMPDCVRSLCSLEELSMMGCNTLKSIEHPPCTLRQLIVRIFKKPWIDIPEYKPALLERISFDPDMSPISINVSLTSFRSWSSEIEGILKIQPLESVEEKVLSSLGWSKLYLDFLNKRHVGTYQSYRGAEEYPIIQVFSS